MIHFSSNIRGQLCALPQLKVIVKLSTHSYNLVQIQMYVMTSVSYIASVCQLYILQKQILDVSTFYQYLRRFLIFLLMATAVLISLWHIQLLHICFINFNE